MTESPDTVTRLNEVGVLTRREIEARILAPVIEAFAQHFDRAHVIEIVRQVVVSIARDQGRALADAAGDTSLNAFAGTLGPWTRDDALVIQMKVQSEEQLDFDVTRCRYAEMYRELGIPELGALLSCNRDGALIEGFNPYVTLTRSQTIMQGANCCDFRYERRRDDTETPPG